MEQFTLVIDTNNAAFEDPGEVPRILRELARKIEECGSLIGTIHDSNGNGVGKFSTFSDPSKG